MIKNLSLKNLLFLDIETVPEHASFEDLSEEKKKLWDLKTLYQRKDEFTPEEFYDKAGIWAEFGKIVCISVGYFAFQETLRTFRITSLHGEEKKLLQEFRDLLENHFSQPKHLLCAHNGKEFDFPYMARRMLIHNMELPEKLNLFGKKPWEVRNVYYLDRNIDRIITYCEKDVVAIAQIILKLRQEPLLTEEEVLSV